jgi:deoxyribodipyrimidine photo-lyase
MKCAVWWIRRDLRLADNPALTQALANSEAIIPLFIIDPKLVASRFVGRKRLAFLFSGLHALDQDLKQIGSRLIVREGDPKAVLAEIIRECGAAQIYAEADHSPYARRRDQGVRAELPLQLLGSTAIHPPESVLKPNGEPYTVFTPFSRAWRELPLATRAAPPPTRIPTPVDLPSLAIPHLSPDTSPTLFPPGEIEANRRLTRFARGDSAPISSYAEGRNQLDCEGTSRLSPYLRFGMLSPRQAAIAAREAIQSAPHPEAANGAELWLNELIWRDFYIHILYHYPQVRQGNFRLEGIAWENDTEKFDAWRSGTTGYPLVDAAMRQLEQTGWMHNRLRMVVASFLSKDLLIDWRWGEQWFMQQLLDGDPAANNGGWQWSAGTGTDAAPYFRVFNPTSQGMKHDPSGDFIRSYLPELASIPGEHIHEPHKTPLNLQQVLGYTPGRDYPLPVVEHGWARQRALSVYAQAKK